MQYVSKAFIFFTEIYERLKAAIFVREALPNLESMLSKPSIVGNLEQLRSDGFSPVTLKLSKTECDKLIELIDNHVATKSVNSVVSDIRLWSAGSDNSPELIRKLMADESIRELATSLMGKDMFVSVVLLNKVFPNGENKGSGGGWHRDGFRDGLKIIFYLNPTDKSGGPLAIIDGSHNRASMINLLDEHGISPFSGSSRSSDFDEKLETLVTDGFLKKTELVSESPGQGYIFNTRALHRGMPMLNRDVNRYAVTLYIEPRRNPVVKNRRVKGGKINL